MEQYSAGIQLASRVTGIPLVTRIQQIVQMAHEVEKAGEPVAYFTAGEPDFNTPEHIRRAAHDALEREYTHYTPNRGLADVRAAIAEKLQRDNDLKADPETEIMVTNGGALSLYLALMATVNSGDQVIVQDPSYGPFAATTRLVGGEPVFAPSVYENGRFRPDEDEIERRITDRTRVIVINSPSNPTGTVYRREELEMIGELACRHNLLILTDEVYERIVYDDHRHYSIAALSPEFRARTMMANSLSKTYAMTGWRIGYLVAPKPIIDAAAYLNQNSARMASAFVQMAAKEALLNSQQATADMVAQYAKRRQLIVEGLNAIPGLSCTPPEGAFYVFLKISQFGLSSFEFAKHLVLRGKVATTPGDFFGPAGNSYVRLSFATDEATIKLGLAGIRSAIAALPRT